MYLEFTQFCGQHLFDGAIGKRGDTMLDKMTRITQPLCLQVQPELVSYRYTCFIRTCN